MAAADVSTTARRVFLSYSGEDAPASGTIAGALRAAGFTVFRDRDSLVPGQFWPERLERELLEADAAVVCLGPGGLGSWQKIEIHLALDRHVRDQIPLVPLRLPGSDDPPLGFLGLNQWVDLRQGVDDPEALRRLFRALQGEPPLAGDEAATRAAMFVRTAGWRRSGRKTRPSSSDGRKWSNGSPIGSDRRR